MTTDARSPWLIASLLLSTSLGRAAAPVFERSDLFEAGHGGYTVCRIPGLIVTAKGTLLAYCEARKGAGGDWDGSEVLVCRSSDGGKTWSPATKLPPSGGLVVKNPAATEKKLGTEGEIVHNNPAAIADRGGPVHFLFCIEYNRCFYTRSDDDGKTFVKPREITTAFDSYRPNFNWQVLATGPGHGIQLKSGRLLVPVWLSTGAGGNAHRPSAVSTIASDDGGATWQRGAIVCADPHPANPSESAAVQLADGRVMLNIRHEAEPHLRVVSVSDNGLTGWSAPQYHRDLPEPICQAALIRLSEPPAEPRTRILFVNPHNPVGRDRKNLTVKLSYDEGKTWPESKTMEPAAAGYSDLAVAADGTIYCFFERCAGKARILSLAKFNLEWLTDGRDRIER
jgi:sialidase-1